MWLWLKAWSFGDDYDHHRSDSAREYLVDSQRIESIELLSDNMRRGTIVRLASGKILYTDVLLSDFAQTLNCESPIVDFRGTLRRQREAVGL